MPSIVSTLRDIFAAPRRRRTDLVVCAYCEVHGVDDPRDGGGHETTDHRN
jgi:hypothetical protein